MSLLLNVLSRLVITFLPRSKRLLISWLQSPSAVILEHKKIKSDTISTVSPSISHEVVGPNATIFVFWMLSFKPTFSLSTFTLCLWPHLKCFDFCWESALLLLLWTNPPQGLFPPSSPLIGNRCSQSWSWAFHFSHSILYSRKAHYWNFPGVQWLRLCTPNNWHSQVKKKRRKQF